MMAIGLPALLLALLLLWPVVNAFGAAAAASAPPAPPSPSAPLLSLAVLGDSDSEAYTGTPERGGAYHATTLQWTEVLARLRGDQIDQGAWGSWGQPGKVVSLQRWLGMDVLGRGPRKHDYRYNFAISGATCDELIGGTHQARGLVSLMDEDPSRWRQGVVVVRIGVNSFGKVESLDQLARDPEAPGVMALIDRCVQQVRHAVALVHAHHPATRVVLVGIFDNAHWPRYARRWQTAVEIRNITAGLDRYDRALRAMAEADRRIAFFDDRAWFVQHWGGRGDDGRPAYHPLVLGRRLVVQNTAGDEPHNAVVADGHAGVVWNTLWAGSLVDFLRQRFGLALRSISEAEALALLTSLGVGPAPAAH